MMKNHTLLKSIGPGILLAGAAIGGSHLLASTTAGAQYGFSLLWIVVLMVAGKYKWLDRAMKIQISLLALATVIALAAAARYNHGFALAAAPPPVWNKTGILFLIALMGWMPAPIELSAWTSLWMMERKAETGHAATVREARIDFHIGYLTTAVLAVVFLSLGALVMFSSGETFQGGADFAKQFVALYTRALGGWIRPVVALAAFITMFSTSVACMDGYPRALAASLQRMVPAWKNRFKPLYFSIMGIMTLLSLLVVGRCLNSLKTLLDAAMILSFLAAPVFAAINYRIVTANFMPIAHRPGKAMRVLSWTGILFLAGFSLFFMISRFAKNW